MCLLIYSQEDSSGRLIIVNGVSIPTSQPSASCAISPSSNVAGSEPGVRVVVSVMPHLYAQTDRLILPQQPVIPSDATSTNLSLPDVAPAPTHSTAPLESDSSMEVCSSVSICVCNSRRSIHIPHPHQSLAADHTDADTNLLEASTAPKVTSTAVLSSETGNNTIGVC